MADEALFTADGDVYVPGECTRGPWSDDAQHAGPIAALIAGLVEDTDRDRGFGVVRITFDLLRPLPLRPLRLGAWTTNAGRSADRVHVEVHAAETGELLATADALRLRRKPVRVPEGVEHEERPRGPESSDAVDFSIWQDRVWFVAHAMETRIAAGHAFYEPGPAAVWFRLRLPVVAGRATTPLQRVCATADSGNGISNVAPFTEMLYINPDLTVTLSREPVGEWVCLDATTRLSPDGFGLTESRLFDEAGRCGLAHQSLLVSTR